MPDDEIIEINTETLDEEELFLDDDLDLEDELEEKDDLGISFGAED